MSEFDFFADVERSIALAEVPLGESSLCRIDPDAPPRASTPTPEERLPEEPPQLADAEAPQEADADVEPRGFQIEVDTGEIVDVSSGALLGRQPSLQAIADADAVLVSLTDDESLISRSHLFVYAVAGGIEARDLGSTNGTVLRRGDRTAAMPPNQPVKVRPGDKLELGVRTVELRER